MKKVTVVFACIAVATFSWWGVKGFWNSEYPCIHSGAFFDDLTYRCSELESYKVSLEEHSDLISVMSPLLGEKVTPPVVVSGKARGYWYFEASFPIRIEDGDGNIVGQRFAVAQDEWMVTDFVPFEGEVVPEYGPRPMRAVLVLQKDNPSGLPENDDEVRIPVIITE